MNKTLKHIVNYKFTIITLLTILFLSLSSGENINKPWFLKFENSDKIVHFGMYGFLTLIYLMERTRFLRIRTKTKQTRWYFVLWIFITGAFIELLQPLLAERQKDIWDFIANTTGIISAYLVFLLIRRYIKNQ
jgi:glycopeptide antibiotics resistance protein